MSKSLRTLLESNLAKAEIVLSIRGEICDKIQRNCEILNNMPVDILGPILDQVKAEQGVEAAEELKNSITGYLQTAVATLMDVNDKIGTEVLKLSGDISDEPGISDLGAGEFDDVDTNPETPTFDMEDDAALPDDVTEPVPDDRAMKESKKLGLMIESTKGSVGKKYFSSKEEMNTWINENKSKIKKVIEVLK